jgi:putative membrane protein
LRIVNFPYWRNFLIVCLCLAISAFYELIEWWVALLSQEAADSFLGTQGYIWDTQSDMGGWHDRQLRNLSIAPAESAV